jgi:hypothetical protein
MHRVFIGMDNGTTGSFGIICDELHRPKLFKTPTKKEQNYKKKKENVTRLDAVKFQQMLEPYAGPEYVVFLIMERPYSGQYKTAELSAVRMLEATIAVLETLGIRYEYVDSREWQKVLLSKGVQGREALKRNSKQIAIRLFPHLKEVIIKVKDGDGILITEFCRLKYSGSEVAFKRLKK